MSKIPAEFQELRELFIKRMTEDSETQDARRKEFNQAIFGFNDDGSTYAVWNETDLDMVLQCFDDAIKDWQRLWCDDCETRNSTIEIAIKNYYESTKSNNTNKKLTNTNNTMYWQKDAFGGVHCSNCWYTVETTGTPSICPCCGHRSLNSL